MTLTTITPVTALAVEKINSVKVNFTIEGYDEYGHPTIVAETNSDNYSCGDVYLESEAPGSSSEDPFYSSSTKAASEENYIVELNAESDHAFYLSKASQVKLNGAGAEYVKASRLENGTLLRITVKFSKLEDVCDTVNYAVWNGDGTASWEPAYNAVRYKLTFGKDKSRKVYYTGNTSYDFKPLMTRPGSYSLSVRPISKSGYIAGGCDAGSTYITTEQAAANREAYGVESETRKKEGVENISGPGTVDVIYKNTGWKQDDTGWWYQNNDGSYVQCDWVQLNNAWYFFGADGYMVSNKVIDWGPDSYYFGTDGKMVVNEKIPDGRTAGADGILIGDANEKGSDSEFEEGDSLSGPGFTQ